MNAATVAPTALRLVAALRAGALLVARPRPTSRAHLYTGPLTPSGRRVPRAGRVLCRARTATLTVLGGAPTAPGDLRGCLAGRIVCRRCMRCTVTTLTGRPAWVAAFGHLTVVDLTVAGAWATTTGEAHQVSRVATMIHGPKPVNPPARRTRDQAARHAMHERIQARRAELVIAERTAAESAALRERQQVEQAERDRATKAHRRETSLARTQDRARDGRYLTPRERDDLAAPLTSPVPEATR